MTDCSMFTPEVGGVLNRTVHLYAYADMNERERTRKDMLDRAQWSDFLTRARPYVIGPQARPPSPPRPPLHAAWPRTCASVATPTTRSSCDDVHVIAALVRSSMVRPPASHACCQRTTSAGSRHAAVVPARERKRAPHSTHTARTQHTCGSTALNPRD